MVAALWERVGLRAKTVLPLLVDSACRADAAGRGAADLSCGPLSADASAEPWAIAAPIPRANASPPTLPTWFVAQVTPRP